MKQNNISSHTKKMIISDRLAKSLIWLAAGFTLTVLVLIVGYILINGVYTRTKFSDVVLPVEEKVLTLDTENGPRDFGIIAYPSLRLKSITYDDLREIYLGLNSYWGYLTGQNRNITPIMPMDPVASESLAQYFFQGENLFSGNVAYYNNQELLLDFLLNNKGSIAIVPVEWLDDMPHVHRVALKQRTLVVHPGLLVLQNERRLSVVTMEQLTALVSGSAGTWADVGGPGRETSREGVHEPLSPLPVFLQNDIKGPFLKDTQRDLEKSLVVDNPQELVTTVLNTPGAFSVVRRDLAFHRELPVLEVLNVTHSLNLRPSFFFAPPSRAGAVGGISTIIINTLVMVIFVLLIATPIGVGAAIYLVMFARQGLLLKILRIGTDTLAGIPSIIFGLFGLVFFSQFLGLKTGLLAGAFTLTIMVLPTIIRTSEEALKSVSSELIEGSMALGATRHQTIMRVILPAASPGILTGIILAIGRAIGETAALLFTMGSNLALIRNLNSPIRVLSVHLYILIREFISVPNAFATATILVLIVFAVNYAIRKLISKMNKSIEV